MPSPAPGTEDLRRAADQLAARLPSALAPLARLAFNYRWSWIPGGERVFATVDPHRWEVCGRNPVRLLQEVATAALERAAADRDLGRLAYSLDECVLAESVQPLPPSHWLGSMSAAIIAQAIAPIAISTIPTTIGLRRT